MLETGSETETAAAGEALGRGLRAGEVVLLYGDLGAGKTAFVRGMARGIGANPDDVTSPTFTVGHRYPGDPDVSHLDLFRFRGISASKISSRATASSRSNGPNAGAEGLTT